MQGEGDEGMRGEVLHYDEAQGFGFISGGDGNRYTFRREDMRRDASLSKGVTVEFEPNNGQAKGVFPIHSAIGTAPPPPGSVPPPAPVLAQPSTYPGHFGRNATTDATYSTSLWDFFWRGMTVNYANFRDRARRKEYWGFILFWLIAMMTLSGIGVAVDSATGNLGSGGVPLVTIIVGAGFVLATLVPGLAITIRRIHDIGLSGWFYLLVFIPSVGSLIIFVFTLIPSQSHDNKWGSVPHGIAIRPAFTPPAA
jgi:uncharacterized membrane protein YhaH (DUF805 family)/cold shock CspA family protein